MPTGRDILKTATRMTLSDIQVVTAGIGLTVSVVRTEPDYRTYRLKKRGGGYRTICVPAPWLKQEQRNILSMLMGRGISAGRYAHGFVRGRSIKTAAELHVGKRIVLKMDLKDFFGTVNRINVIKSLERTGLPKADISHIVGVCTHNDMLPQGSPTSPFLANLAFSSKDELIYRYVSAVCDPVKVVYTRYADDLTFSSNSYRLSRAVPRLNRLIRDFGYEVNIHKTRVMRPSRVQMCTGVVVNKKVNIPRKRRRAIRAEIHNAKTRILAGGRLSDKNMARLHGLAGYGLMLSQHHGQGFRKEVQEIAALQQSLTGAEQNPKQTCAAEGQPVRATSSGT